MRVNVVCVSKNNNEKVKVNTIWINSAQKLEILYDDESYCPAFQLRSCYPPFWFSLSIVPVVIADVDSFYYLFFLFIYFVVDVLKREMKNRNESKREKKTFFFHSNTIRLYFGWYYCCLGNEDLCSMFIAITIYSLYHYSILCLYIIFGHSEKIIFFK